MIRTTPFHERLSVLNETGLWEHWAGHLVATKYQMAEKSEYFAVRNSAAIFDTSPLFKYRIHGPGAERFLAGVLARDIRTCPAGHAQYTVWCDDRGHVVEDGVILHLEKDEFILTAAEPNLAYFTGLVAGHDVEVEDVTEAWGVLAFQGPRSRDLLAGLAPAVAKLPYFGLIRTKIDKVPVIVSRTGFTGDLGFEVWAPAADALRVWDALWKVSRGQGVVPFGMIALYMPASRPASSSSTSTSTRAASPGPTRTAPRPSSSAWAGCSRASRPTIARSSAGTRSGGSAPRRARAGSSAG